MNGLRSAGHSQHPTFHVGDIPAGEAYEGLRMTQFPVARAGAILPMAMQGVSMPTRRQSGNRDIPSMSGTDSGGASCSE